MIVRVFCIQDAGIILTDEEYATITVQLDREMTGIINYRLVVSNYFHLKPSMV